MVGTLVVDSAKTQNKSSPSRNRNIEAVHTKNEHLAAHRLFHNSKGLIVKPHRIRPLDEFSSVTVNGYRPARIFVRTKMMLRPYRRCLQCVSWAGRTLAVVLRSSFNPILNDCMIVRHMDCNLHHY